ncbi:MAG: ABC transporter permease subunit [Holosporales bacterium]|jgi:putrescine transport system permease protein|nr:ABC transporter permease subunit [Holosporales bacterium]
MKHPFKKGRRKTPYDILSRRGHALIAVIPYAWLLVFFLIPCLFLLRISLSDAVLARPPYTNILSIFPEGLLQIRLNIGSYLTLFQDELYQRGVITSLSIAGLSTLCCLLIGYPMAYTIARSSEKVRLILQLLVILPFWTSFLIRVYAWIALLSPTGVINGLLLRFNLIAEPLALMQTPFAVCLGIVYAYLPFMVLPLCVSIARIDTELLDAAHDLGCRPLKTFLTITLPLSLSGMIAGSVLVFIPAIGEYVIPELLGGSETLTIGRIVWNEFFVNMSWPVASALSILLVFFVVLPISFWQRWREMKA